MASLRSYQEEPVRKAIDFFKQESPAPALMVLPTAWGKSWLTAYVARSIDPDDHLLVIQPTKELLEQNYDKYISLCGELAEAGIYSASFGKKVIKKITYATIGSIKNLGEMFREYGFTKMLVDEAHLYPRKEESMIGQFLADSGITHVLGITATPLKLETVSSQKLVPKKDQNGSVITKNGKPVMMKVYDGYSKLVMLTNPSNDGSFFRDIIHIGQIQEMTRLGFWSALKYDIQPFDPHGLELNSSGSEFSEKSEATVYEKNDTRNRIRAALDYYRNCKHCLVFVPSVEEAETLASLYPNSACVSGNTPKKERQRVIDKFRSGEIRVVFNVNVLSCLSSDTEILTEEGWQGQNEISYSSKIAQYDLETEEITFEHPLNIIRKKYSGQMVYSDNKYMSIRITGDHTVYYHKKTTNGAMNQIAPSQAIDLVGKKYIYIPITGNATPRKIVVEQKKLPTQARFIATNAYNYRQRGLQYDESIRIAREQYEIKKNLRYKNPDELTQDECRFIGFWLGDGSKQKVLNNGQKSGVRYTLSQSHANPAMIEWVESLLNKCGIHFTYREIKETSSIIAGRKARFSSARAYNLWLGSGGRNQNVKSTLYQLTPYLEKEGTSLLWGLNKRQYYALMEGFFKANGNHGNNKEYKGGIISPHKKLVDLLQAIGVCRGYRIMVTSLRLREQAKTPLYKITLSEIRYHEFVNDTLKKEKVTDEKVWCVTMPKGTIVTRRNGRVSIIGNCGFDYTGIDCIVLGSSTASIARYYQILGRGVRIEDGKQDCLVVDFGGNVKRFGHIEDLSYEWEGIWRMYGTNGNLLSGIPIECLGCFNRDDVYRMTHNSYGRYEVMPFGKYKGWALSDTPLSYLRWYVRKINDDPEERESELSTRIRIRLENDIRDTRNEPPILIMPTGIHQEKLLSEIPKNYLTWMYRNTKWTPMNDSLRRGIELALGNGVLFEHYYK